MGKTRFGVLDLQVQARELNRRLVGARVANVYDVNSRTYVLKLTVPPARTHHTVSSDSQVPAQKNPGDSDGWSKVLLLIESGARVHTTNFVRDYGSVPSGFCLKLRKHIRTRRIDSVTQLGSDRMLMLSFSGGGEAVCSIFVEFYAGGNIVLTAPDYTVLAMLRTRRQGPPIEEGGKGEEGGTVSVGCRFPIESARPATKLSREAFDAAVLSALAALEQAGDPQTDKVLGRAARRRRAQAAEARKALAAKLELGPQLVEHALVRAGVDPGAGIEVFRATVDIGEKGGGCARNIAEKVFEGLREIETMVKEMPARGLKFMKEDGKGDGEAHHEQKESLIEDISPFMLAQFEGRSFEECDTFDDAVDAYFVQLEMGRAEAAKAKRAAVAYKKVDKLTSELHGQVLSLESTQILSRQKAQAIESNIVEVDAAITVVSSALAAAVDWDHLGQMVEEEKTKGNPVAQIIHSLHLERNEITLMLEDAWGVDGEDGEDLVDDDGDSEDGEGDEDGFSGSENGREPVRASRKKSLLGCSRKLEPSAATRKAMLVDVDLGLSAYANAREYYVVKKTAAMKMEKAVEATDRTIKLATRKAASDAKKMEAEAVASSIRSRRKPYWFEKFHWMVSSENYLVVAGRDAQQNELLVKRYMGPHDAYVHADVHGASSVVVKNQKGKASSDYSEIPRLTLEQAGTFAMCRSKAWEDKIVTSAWWVRASQVSKTAPSGFSLGTGSFVIRGKKNFLDPRQLVMGFAFLFKISESCVAKHLGERHVRGQDKPSPSFTGVTEGEGSSLLAAPMASQATVEGGALVVASSRQTLEGSALVEKEQEEVSTGRCPGSVVCERNEEVIENGKRNGAADANPALCSSEVPSSGNDLGEESDGTVTRGTNQGKNAEVFSTLGSTLVSSKSTVHSDRIDTGESAASSGGKYDLPSSPVKDPVVSGTSDDGTVGRREAGDTSTGSLGPSDRGTKPRMSAKERRMQKKAKVIGKPLESQYAPNSEAGIGSLVSKAEQTVPRQDKKDTGLAPSSALNSPLPRGKRNKLKKMKKKYGDQDDEERQIALAVLGAKEVKEFLPERDAIDNGGSVGQPIGNVGEGTANDLKLTSPHESDKGLVAVGGRVSKTREKKEVMRLLEEEGILELSELEKESLSILDMLTATPFADDIVEFALPVCAPYAALAGYRYRVKLVPGTMKRGKAYRASFGLFMRQAEKELRLHVQERDSMRLCPENDAIQAMLASVRVAAPGLVESQKGNKKGKRAGKK